MTKDNSEVIGYRLSEMVKGPCGLSAKNIVYISNILTNLATSPNPSVQVCINTLYAPLLIQVYILNNTNTAFPLVQCNKALNIIHIIKTCLLNNSRYTLPALSDIYPSLYMWYNLDASSAYYP